MPASSRRVGRAMESLVPTRRRGTTFNQKLPAASLPVSAPYGLASAPSLLDTKERPAPGGGPPFAMESTPGGRLAARQETSCWREYRHRSFIVAGKRLKRASRLAWTRIIPRPICRRSIHCSADPWPRRSSVSRVDFDRGPPSLHVFLSLFVGGFRGGGWISRSQDSLLTRQTEGESSRRRELRHSLRVDSKSWF